jgi:hypothetical protein
MRAASSANDRLCTIGVRTGVRQRPQARKPIVMDLRLIGQPACADGGTGFRLHLASDAVRGMSIWASMMGGVENVW